MPKNVRPSWITVDVDGRENDVNTGPKSRSGSMNITIFVRKNGDVHKAGEVSLIASSDGSRVVLTVELEDETLAVKTYKQ